MDAQVFWTFFFTQLSPMIFWRQNRRSQEKQFAKLWASGGRHAVLHNFCSRNWWQSKTHLSGVGARLAIFHVFVQAAIVNKQMMKTKTTVFEDLFTRHGWNPVRFLHNLFSRLSSISTIAKAGTTVLEDLLAGCRRTFGSFAYYCRCYYQWERRCGKQKRWSWKICLPSAGGPMIRFIPFGGNHYQYYKDYHIFLYRLPYSSRFVSFPTTLCWVC